VFKNLCFLLSGFSALAIHAAPFSNVIQKSSLLKHHRAVHSQYGEEGVIDAILKRIGVQTGFLVEFGGYDGICMSNTRLLAERGWRGAFIEPDTSLFTKEGIAKLHSDPNLRFFRWIRFFAKLPQILCIKEFVTPFVGGQQGFIIDEIADRYFPQGEIDMMSIDIDSLDHLIFKNLKRRPKLNVIEGGMFWHLLMQLEVPDEIAARSIQQPICVMARIAKQKGYELICSTFNAFFIREDLYHHFVDIDNDPRRLWCEAFLYIKKIYPKFYKEILYRNELKSWPQDGIESCQKSIFIKGGKIEKPPLYDNRFLAAFNPVLWPTFEFISVYKSDKPVGFRNWKEKIQMSLSPFPRKHLK